MYVPRDRSLFLDAYLDGPTGRQDLLLKHDAWVNQAPAGDYYGLSFYSEVRLPDEVTMPAGDYTYAISINYPEQWTCSQFYSDVCRQVGGVTRQFTYDFTFDGETALMTPPNWVLNVSNARIAKNYFGERLPRIRVSSNMTAGLPILLQRKTKTSKYKTVVRAKMDSGSTPFQSAFIYDKRMPKSGSYTYRVVVQTPFGDVVSNPAKLRIK